MTIKIVRDKITRSELQALAQETYGEMIKAVVDVRRDLLAAGGEMHKDGEATLLVDGSAAHDLWGVCIRFEGTLDEALEFSSHINIRPEDGNPTIHIRNEQVLHAVSDVLRRHVEWER